jgi:PhnB protein
MSDQKAIKYRSVDHIEFDLDVGRIPDFATTYCITNQLAPAFTTRKDYLVPKCPSHFAFRVRCRQSHAELRFGASTVMLADEYPDFGALSPDTIGGCSVTMHLATTSVDADLMRASKAGAMVLRAAANQSFGERNAVMVDPFGHRWMLSQTIEPITSDEMQRRWNEETGA